MKSFKVGDRVRIVCPRSENNLNGREGTVWNIVEGAYWSLHPDKNGMRSYQVDVDGVGKYGRRGFPLGYVFSELEPIVNPDETAWTEFKRYLQPDPIILAKEPA